ncbi:MAG: HPt (histidine-containing phosphotransfer) domain-containing protein [Paraglaciecola sp.]
MINNNLPLFDSKFALNQFSGNQSLLNKMLDTFCEQYATFAEQLSTSIKQNDLATAKRDVHTIKGVGGNLGMKALHQASLNLETHLIKQTTVTQSAVTAFTTIFSDTLSALEQFKKSKAEEQRSATSASNANEQDARQLLLSSLKRNEFITHAKLNAWMDDLSLAGDTLHVLQNAINDLDYEKAISLLE